MEFISIFKNYFLEAINKSAFGLSFIEIIFIIISFLISIILRKFFATIILSRIKNFILRTGNKVDDYIFDTLIGPLKILPVIFVLIFVSIFTDLESQMNFYLDKVNKTLVTIFLFWFAHQSLSPLSIFLKKLEAHLSKALVNWLTKSLKYLIIFLGIVAVLEIWGIKIGPIIAGLGLFGVAVALGAQDLFKNLISGLIIIFEKRFKIDDTIEIPGHATGIVEHIGFRSTVIRQFDTTPISIPNYIFSDTSIINYSNRNYRRIKWTIGLVYETSIIDLKNICQNIEAAIKSNRNFIIDENHQLFVRVEKFNDSSIDLLIYTFANTNNWDNFLEIQEELAFIIKQIVDDNGSSFAYPTQSLHIHK